ncbi:MAG: hypothetical protein ACP5VR_03270, partial [Acidimicrobiales bacterium]
PEALELVTLPARRVPRRVQLASHRPGRSPLALLGRHLPPPSSRCCDDQLNPPSAVARVPRSAFMLVLQGSAEVVHPILAPSARKVVDFRALGVLPGQGLLELLIQLGRARHAWPVCLAQRNLPTFAMPEVKVKPT